MAGETPGQYPKDVPAANYARGLSGLELPPEFGIKKEGKVRDRWDVGDHVVIVTTDRTSAYDRAICAIPGKGAVLNSLSAHWFEQTWDIVPNHLIEVPHPNVLIATRVEDDARLPVEVVLRRYMAKSSTSTSVYRNYSEGRRNIYGIDFPDGLVANQELPMGTIVTPTTKADSGHDEPLTDDEARALVDGQIGAGIWDQAKDAALRIFERGQEDASAAGLILVDTKYEFGVDADGELMLIDEVHTPDSSRYWLKDTYAQRLAAGETPDTFDKEILRRWLAEQGFSGDGPVPVVEPSVIDQMSAAYRVPYERLTGETLLEVPVDQETIRAAILPYVSL